MFCLCPFTGAGHSALALFWERQSPGIKEKTMPNAEVSNPNDYKVVSFHNSTNFGFTPEMGCMYDGRAINGKNGSPGIDPGETIILPYHVGHRLATNLAKRVLNTSPAATVDPAGIPTGVPIWSESALQQLAQTYITELYTENKAVPQSETDILMAKVEEYRKMVESLVAKVAPTDDVKTETPLKVNQDFTDKQEVLRELENRGIKHDKRANKANLEKLLV